MAALLSQLYFGIVSAPVVVKSLKTGRGLFHALMPTQAQGQYTRTSLVEAYTKLFKWAHKYINVAVRYGCR